MVTNVTKITYIHAQYNLFGSGSSRRVILPSYHRARHRALGTQRHRHRDARCALSTSFRRGGRGESTPTRSQQGYYTIIAGGGNQDEAMSPRLRPLGAAPTPRHSRATSQDARLAAESLVGMGLLRAPKTPSSQHGCRTTLGGGGAQGGIGLGPSPPLPPGATAGSLSQERPPPPPPEKETCEGRRQEIIDQLEVGPVTRKYTTRG